MYISRYPLSPQPSLLISNFDNKGLSHQNSCKRVAHIVSGQMAPTAFRPANEHVIAGVNVCQDNSSSRCDVSVAGIGGDIVALKQRCSNYHLQVFEKIAFKVLNSVCYVIIGCISIKLYPFVHFLITIINM